MKSNRNSVVHELDEIVAERFGLYAKYIIQERALPDVRDGLKPVQRRILYAMNNLGLFFDRPHKKSVRVVGEVIGKYHPHGDVPIYEAMVRMAQPWKLRVPLIDGHGNFGSIDGDSAAAMRYTETRLNAISKYLLQDLDKKTVGWTPNFDDSETEPTVLPAYFPNLLLNGCMGIAAGYATNIPPHNLSELIVALVYRLNNPECSLKEIMKIIKGPDLPTGGIIQGRDGILNAYKTGRGKIIIRSKMELQGTPRHRKWVIKELPYEVVKSDLVTRIADIKEEQKLSGIKDIIDLSDMSGVHIEINLQQDADAETIRKYLLKHSNLQVSYNLNMVVLEDNKPICAGILNLLDAYLKHQFDIVQKRTKYDLEKAIVRLEIVSGLIKVTTILDKVIATIRKSTDKANAKKNLIKTYHFTELQSEAIVSLRLYRLTSTDVNALKEEEKSLQKEIRTWQEIIKKKEKQKALIIQQLQTISQEFNSPRKTVIENMVEEIIIEKTEIINEENIFVTISRDGYIKVINEKVFAKQDMKDYGRKPLDINVASLSTTSLSTLLLFTSQGNYCIVPLHKVKESRWKDIGQHVNNFSTMTGDERVLGAILINDFDIQDQFVILATKLGFIKRTVISDFKATRISKALKAINLQPNDEVVGFDLSNGKKQVILTTKKGFVVRYDENDIAIISAKAKGVKAINLKDDDKVVSLNVVNDEHDSYVSFTTAGVKKIKINNIPLLHRPAKGVHSFKITKTIIPYVITSFVIPNNSKVHILTKNNTIENFAINKVHYGRLLESVSYFLEDVNVEWIQDDRYYDLRKHNLQSASLISSLKKDKKISNANDQISLSMDDILND